LKERVAVLGHVGVVPCEVVVDGYSGGIRGVMAWGGMRCGAIRRWEDTEDEWKMGDDGWDDGDG
jgi:hypothetical protein